LHQRAKFRKDRSIRSGDIAIFIIFKTAAAAMLDFQKIAVLVVRFSHSRPYKMFKLLSFYNNICCFINLAL